MSRLLTQCAPRSMGAGHTAAYGRITQSEVCRGIADRLRGTPQDSESIMAEVNEVVDAHELAGTINYVKGKAWCRERMVKSIKSQLCIP